MAISQKNRSADLTNQTLAQPRASQPIKRSEKLGGSFRGKGALRRS
jgi:hypothetical protein